MAVLPGVPGLKVEIAVRGVPLEEFVDEGEEDPDRTATKYIESRSGSEFEVLYTFTRPFPESTVLVKVNVDGNYVAGLFAEQSSFHGHGSAHSISGKSTLSKGQWYEQKLSFSDLAIGKGHSETFFLASY
jgi:hypothetical protein